MRVIGVSVGSGLVVLLLVLVSIGLQYEDVGAGFRNVTAYIVFLLVFVATCLIVVRVLRGWQVVSHVQLLLVAVVSTVGVMFVSSALVTLASMMQHDWTNWLFSFLLMQIATGYLLPIFLPIGVGMVALLVLTVDGVAYKGNARRVLYWSFGVVLLLFAVFVSWKMIRMPELTHENYYFPAQFEGCAVVFYNIREAEALPFEEGVVTYRFQENSVLLTSSPPDLGWEGLDSSGFHTVDYFIGGVASPSELYHGALGELNDEAGTLAFKQVFQEDAQCVEQYDDVRSLYEGVRQEK